MKKFYNFLSFTWLVALAILLSTGGVQAQLAPQYPLTISTGTYSSISATGTSVASGDEVGTNITGLTGFTVNGVSYTNARMCSNGWLALYGTTAPTATTNYTALSTAMTNGAVIFAPFGRDLNTNANSGTAWWQQVGNELVFEWKNFNRYGYTDVLNFQIRLNTSTGDIKFVYGTMTPAAYSTYPQVGWKTNGTVATNWSTDINNVMIDVTGSPNTCNWSNVVTGNLNTSTCYFNSANSGVVPASGLTYSWTKPNGTDPNPVRTFSAVSGITGSAATLTWTAPTGASQYNVQYRAIGSCTWTNFSGNPVSSATATLTGLSPATTYQIRVQSGNSSVNGLWSHIPNQAGTGSGYVAAGTFTTLAACPATTATAATNITATTASANWSTATGSWIIEYGPTATFGTPGTGATAGNVNNTVVTASNVSTKGLTGLTPATGYSYVVRQDCSGGGNGYSTNSNVITFTTACNAISTYPYTQGFSATMPSCWAASEDVAGASYHWAPTTADATHGAAAPQAGTHFMYLYVYLASSTYNSYNLTTAAFNLGATPKLMSYYYFLGPDGYTSSPVPMTVKISTDGGSTWTNLYQHDNNNSTFGAWTQNTISLSAYANQTVLIRFASNSNYGSNICDQGLDEFSIYDVPTCPATTATAATNITATTASANWSTATGSWIIEYGPTATFGTPGTGATAGNVNNTVVTASNVSTIGLTGLNASTGYSYVVRQDCSGSGNGYSANSNVITFTTACNAVTTFPFIETFEDDSDSRDCWLNDYVSGNLPWALTDGDQGGGSVNSAHSGVLNAIFWQSADNGYETRLVSPSFDFTGKSKLYLDFYYANEEWAGSQSELRIYYKVGAGAWTLIPGAVYTTSVNAWTFVHLDLPSSDNASDYKIAFDGINQWSRGIVLDDVLINAKPDDCSNALGISSDPVTDYINPGTQFMSNATKSSVPDGSCFTTSPSSKDMWYKITTNGDNGSVLNLTVTPDASMDVALTLFDGTCGTLNAVACSNANSAGVAENMIYTLPLWDGGIEVRNNKVYFLRVTDIGGNGTSFTIGNNGSTALPLTLLSFKAQQVKRGEVLLDWRVKDEVNMKQYDVQRSVDGKNFTTIGTVNNLGKEVYTLIDPKPAQGINYYRLSMVESNGLTNYSHIVAININDGKALHASPNPVTGDLTVEVKGEVGKQAVIDIIDYTGNKVRTVAIPAGKVTVDMTSLPTGVYVVQYIDGTTVYTTRVVKM